MLDQALDLFNRATREKAHLIPTSAFVDQTIKEKAALGIYKISEAFRTGELKLSGVMTHPFRTGFSHPEPIGEIFIDYGISLHYYGESFRLTGSIEEFNSLSSKYVPFFEKLIPDEARVLTRAFWSEVYELLYPVIEEFYNTRILPAVDSLKESATALAQKHEKKIKKARERAVRPDVVEKKESKAREKAIDSFAKELNILKSADWDPELLHAVVDLCRNKRHVVESLVSWAARNPLGSKVLRVEDVQIALNMAKAQEVMES